MDNPAPLMHEDWIRWFQAVQKAIETPISGVAPEQITMTAPHLLGRTTAGTGGAEEISVSGPLTLSALTLGITGSALTRVNDTNVTLTLGGSPSLALLAATSLTLGWTGVLSVARGGTGTGTAFTQGSVIFAGSGGTFSEDNTNFFWDDTNNKLGIGTTVPKRSLHVNDGGPTNIAAALLPGAVVCLLSGAASGTLQGVAASSISQHRPGLYLRGVKAAGTLDTPTSVIAEDSCVFAEGEGYDGTARQPIANLGMYVEAVNGAAVSPQSKLSGYINFLTQPLLGTAGPVERVRITSTGVLAVNIISPSTTSKVHVNQGALAVTLASGLVPGNLGVVVTNNSSAPYGGIGASNTANIPGMYLRSVRARGTLDVPLVVQAGDTLFKLGVDAWDGASRVADLGAIEVFAEGTIASTRVPTRMVFSTATDAAPSVPTEAMRIDSAQHVGIGVTPTALLHLKAGTTAASTAPLKLTSGTVMTAAEAGAVEFTTDTYFATITTAAARKGIVLDDGARLTSGSIPVATTNGRLIDGPSFPGSVLGVTNGGTGTGTAFTAGSVVFAGASGVYSQDNANFFWDDSNNRLILGSTLALGTTSTDADVLQNTTAATSGVTVQISPRTRWSGTAWDSDDSVSRTVSFFAEVLPGTAATVTGRWKLGFINPVTSAITYPLTVTQAGVVTALTNFECVQFNASGSGSIGSTSTLQWNSSTRLTGVSDGKIIMQNDATTSGAGFDVTTDAVLKLRTRAHTGYATLDCLGLKASGAAGASFGPGLPTSITVVNGIVTAIS